MADSTAEGAPCDPFRKTYTAIPPPKPLPGKAFTQNLVNPGNIKKTAKRHVTNWRYTEVEHRYSSVKDRLFDNIPVVYASDKDYEPLYSSFAANKVFVEP